MRRFLNFILPKRNEEEKKEYMAQKMVENWKNNDSKMRDLMS